MRLARFVALAGTAVATLATSAALQAAPLGGFFRDVNTGYHRNKYWPEPFIYADRERVGAPMVIMIRKGWEEENLIGDHHFKTGTNELTESGQLKIRWIMTQAEQGYRTVYVERSNTPQQTSERLAATRRYAQQIAIGDEKADVRESDMVGHGWPAEYLDDINVKFRQSTPDPRLPAQQDAGSTSSGGSSSGQ
ncbi:MAG: hypothetical protein K8T25_16935 [Planctomycetia bacterium]|nr:hypothetical protein [Planctomycetia bacterium]